MKITATNNSSMIASVAFDPDKSELTVEFKNGKRYSYGNIEEKQYDEFVNSDSVGKYFNANFRGKDSVKADSKEPDK